MMAKSWQNDAKMMPTLLENMWNIATSCQNGTKMIGTLLDKYINKYQRNNININIYIYLCIFIYL